MKKLLLVIIVISVIGIVNAQNRENFKYQAVIRNNAGEVIAKQNVSLKINILQDSESGTLAYSESHSITTNEFGLASLNIGNGTIISGTFDGIEWGAFNYFLQLGIDIDGGSSYETIGVSPLLSVPYSLHAKTVSNANVIGKPNTGIDEALFAVTNSSRDTVFAVYQEGVRVNVSDGNQKAAGSRGGFAVGNLSTGKGSLEYLRVTPDSVRIYINETKKAAGSRGGFAVGNLSTGKGSSSYMHLTEDNYFIGRESGISNTTGLYNTFFGYQSGYSNTTGDDNIFIGHGSGFSNTEGIDNVFIGNDAGFSNLSGSSNVFLGNGSGYSNLDGVWNVFMGNWAGNQNTTGISNVIIGDASGENNTTGSSNVFVGDWSGASNTEGSGNVFLGGNSGWSNISGNYNVFLGEESGFLNSEGEGNVFLGSSSGYSNTTGNYNVFLGDLSGVSNTTGYDNIFLGDLAGSGNTTGFSNIYIGEFAGYSNETGYSNVFIGPYAGAWELGSEKLYISNYEADSTESLIFGDFYNEILQVNYSLGIGKYPEVNELELEGDASKTIAGNWLANSDKRIKTDIKEIDNALETIMKLHPVKFKYTEAWKAKHPSIKDRYYYNYIAQEYEIVFPSSVKKGCDDLSEKSDEKVLQMDSYNAQIVAVKAIQELVQENNELKEMVLKLTERIEKLEQNKK